MPSIEERGLAPFHPLSNATLLRRVMQPPARGNPALIGPYVMLGSGPQSTAEAIVWSDDRGNQINTAKFWRIGKNAFSLTTVRLKGCTMLAIMSRKGVYIGHYWENIAFDPDQEQLIHEDLEGVEWTETPDQAFERSVIDGLRSGIKLEQESLTSVKTALADDSVRAYLIHPTRSAAKELQLQNDPNSASPLPDGYPTHWQRMKEEVIRIIPTINQPGRWSEILYEATDDVVLHATTSRGKLLFEFDPMWQVPNRREKPERMMKLWSESTEIHSDVWKE
jgi:hypothetical protein